MRSRSHAAPRFRSWAVVAMVLALAVFLRWLWAHEGHAPLPTRGITVDQKAGTLVLTREAREALDTRSVTVEAGGVPDWILAYVKLVAPWQRHAFAGSRLPGKIVRLHSLPGARVEAGAELADVQSGEFENLQLEILTAQNDLRLAEKLMQELQRGGVNVAEQTLAEAENRQRQRRQAFASARSKWFSLGLGTEALDRLLTQGAAGRLATLPIRSPIAGTVVHADLAVGKVVEPNEHLFEIVDLSKIWVKIEVLEADLRHVKTGLVAELQVTAYPNDRFLAPITVAGLYLDPDTHVNAVWGELENPQSGEPRFLPGMTGQAHIRLPSQSDTLRVPASSVIDDGVNRYVLVEESQTESHTSYRRQYVEVVRQTPSLAEVRASSLFPGDRVLERGSYILARSFVPELLRLAPETEKSIGLRTERVRAHVIDEIVELDGAVEMPPERRSLVASPLAGTVQAIHVGLGQQVAQGAVVAEIANLEVQNLQLELLQEHNDIAYFEQEYNRVKAGGDSVPRRRLMEVESALHSGRNRRDALRRRLTAGGFSSEQVDEVLRTQKIRPALPVRATVGGTVVHFDKVLGQSIRADEPLFEIHDVRDPWIRGYVPERELARLRPGQATRVRLIADPDSVLHAKVVRSSHVVAEESRVSTAWLELLPPAHSTLRHGQVARLSVVVGRTPESLAVPLSAVVYDGKDAYVFVRNSDGTFGRKSIVPGRADDQRVAVLHGLSGNEVIAVTGAAALQTAHAAVR